MPDSSARNTRVQLLRCAAAVVLLAGHADLAAGGLTLGPVLLVVAYLGLVPVAVLAR